MTRRGLSSGSIERPPRSKPYDLLLREMVVSGKKITDYHRADLNWNKAAQPHPFRFQLQKKGRKGAVKRKTLNFGADI